MRTRATIWTYENTVSASGEPSKTLVEFGQFWCAVRVRDMSVITDGKIATTIARHDITFRYSTTMATLPENAQIEIDGRFLYVNGISFDDYKKRYIKVTAADRR